MCVCGRFTSSKFGHTGYQMVSVHYTDKESNLSVTDGINTQYACIYLVLDFTLHTNNVFST